MARRRLRAALVACLTVASLIGAAGPHAAADTRDRIRSAQRQLAALDQEAEVYAERMNAARDAYATAVRRAETARREAQTDDAKLADARVQLGRFAAQVYTSGGTFGMTGLFDLSGDPSQTLDKMALLDAVSRSQQQVLVSFAAARHDAAQATATARAAADAAKAVLARIDAARGRILADAAKTEALLRTLHRQQAAAAAAAAAAALASQSSLPPPPATGVGAAQAAQTAVRWASSELGKPYVWGAAGPDSFDCSGLIQYIYGKAGIYLPHYTGDQWNSGRHVTRDQLRPGDLVFYFSDLHHMGIYIGGGRVIHAPHTGDVVRIAPLDMDPYAGAVRVAG